MLKDTSNPVWSFGANLIAPLYQGGALRAQVEIRSAEQKQAVAEYARAGQRAFAEVENALAAENVLRDRDAILGATIRDSARALELAQIQYRVGSVDLRAVEQSQLALYTARIVAAARANRAAGAARQPVSGARRRIRPAGDGAGGGAVNGERATASSRACTLASADARSDAMT